MVATTLGVVIPLAEEMRAFAEVFLGAEWKGCAETRGSRVFYIYCPKQAADRSSELRIVVTLQEAMGNGPAQEATTALISHYAPDLVIGLGICGAIHKDLRIGDVVVVNAVFDVIDAAKVEDAPQSPTAQRRPDSLNLDLKLMMRPQVPTPLLVNQASQIEWWANSAFTTWQARCFDRLTRFGLDPSERIPRNDVRGESREEPWTHGRPQLMCGASASGFVMEALSFLRVHAFNRELRIVETECAGVARACRGEHVLTPYMFMRVVTDYADKTSRGADTPSEPIGAPLTEAEKVQRAEADEAHHAKKARDREQNEKRREWATRNVMDLFCELAKQAEFTKSVHNAIERQWDASVLLGRFHESREIEFPRERALALAQVFTTLVNGSPDAPNERKRLCVSAESLAMTAVYWDFALPDHDKIKEVWILRPSVELMDGLAEKGVASVDANQRFESNLNHLRDSLPYASFRVGTLPHVTSFHGAFHGDTFWIGHWEVNEHGHRLTSSTDFRLINGRNAPDVAAHYRALFEKPFLDPNFGTPYPPRIQNRIVTERRHCCPQHAAAENNGSSDASAMPTAVAELEATQSS